MFLDILDQFRRLTWRSALRFCGAGLYLLVRDMSQLDTLQSTLSPDFGWSLCAPRQDEATGVITGARAVRSPTNLRFR